jgi:hypothetical protein
MKLTREEMIEKLVELWSDNMELNALIEYFEEKQTEWLDSLQDDDVAQIYATDFEGEDDDELSI